LLRRRRGSRRPHPIKLAAFDNDAGESLFHPPDIDPSASAEMKQQLADFKKRYGVRARLTNG
jgi:hypothetical protein